MLAAEAEGEVSEIANKVMRIRITGTIYTITNPHLDKWWRYLLHSPRSRAYRPLGDSSEEFGSLCSSVAAQVCALLELSHKG